MPYHREGAKIAVRLHQELGAEGLSFVSARVEEARSASDHAGVRLWNDVADELAILVERVHVVANKESSSSSWRLMQRIEYCRHRAMEAEQIAATASEDLRERLLDLAVRWRDMALDAHLLLAQLSKKPGRGETADSFEPDFAIIF
jgi:hypothetical protein